MRINSSSGVFKPHIHLSTNSIEEIESYFSPAERDIPRVGIVTSHLHVKVSEQALSAPHTVQITGNISFPSQYVATGEGVRTISNDIIENSNLAGTVLEPRTISERFEEFWTVYGGLLSSVAGGFAAGLVTLLFERIRTSKKAHPR